MVSSKPPFIQEQQILSGYTSWQVGGLAEYFCLPKTLDEIREVQTWAQTQKLKITVLGSGSNVLIHDDGIRGLVICMRDFSGMQWDLVGSVWQGTVKAGTGKSDLLKFFLREKLAPALFLAGIPGDVGGGVVMNAGVAESFVPREFCEIVDWVEVLKPDGTLQRLQKNQLTWDYRHSHGWQPGIVVQVGLRWENTKDDQILVQVRDANKLRLSKQPLDKPSCGSVFRNPPGKKAAQLIDSCGLKGYTVGAAQVSLKHANFIVNLGGARAADIWSVIEHVREVVNKQVGVELQTEVVRLG